MKLLFILFRIKYCAYTRTQFDISLFFYHGLDIRFTDIQYYKIFLQFLGPHIWTDYHKLKTHPFKFRTIIFELGQPDLKDSFLDKMSRDLTLNWINPWFRKIFQNGCPQSVFFSSNPPSCGWPGGWPVPPLAASAVISERSRKYPQVKYEISGWCLW